MELIVEEIPHIKMWEICCCSIQGGFSCELPPGEYMIGNPDEMLLPGVLKTITFDTGCFEQVESDGIIVVHTFELSKFILNISDVYRRFFSEKGKIAIMSSDIVKPLPEFNQFRFNCEKRAAVELKNALTLTCGRLIVSAEEEDRIYADASDAIGVV
jgi:hypothetical protein